MRLRFHAIVIIIVVDAIKAIADYNANSVESVIDMKKENVILEAAKISMRST